MILSFADIQLALDVPREHASSRGTSSGVAWVGIPVYRLKGMLDEYAVLVKALEVAVEDISEMDKGARYKIDAYLAAGRRRISE